MALTLTCLLQGGERNNTGCDSHAIPPHHSHFVNRFPKSQLPMAAEGATATVMVDAFWAQLLACPPAHGDTSVCSQQAFSHWCCCAGNS
jgi:hypothetical protein